MNPNWAEENLQTIRTLMERSALYRRALAPIMLFAGVLGILAATAGLYFGLKSAMSFELLWLATASVALVGSFVIARRQALKENDKFWSPPTRRVALALAPPLLAGLCIGASPAFVTETWPAFNLPSALVWIMFYGCALHAAGFFMPRGIRLFGWCFMGLACALFMLFLGDKLRENFFPHLLMGFFFGALHLAYGIYLYFTEKKTPNA
jgi:hypothetical protein